MVQGFRASGVGFRVSGFGDCVEIALIRGAKTQAF